MTDAGSLVELVFYPKKNFLVNLQSQVVHGNFSKNPNLQHRVVPPIGKESECERGRTEIVEKQIANHTWSEIFLWVQRIDGKKTRFLYSSVTSWNRVREKTMNTTKTTTMRSCGGPLTNHLFAINLGGNMAAKNGLQCFPVSTYASFANFISIYGDRCLGVWLFAKPCRTICSFQNLTVFFHLTLFQAKFGMFFLMDVSISVGQHCVETTAGILNEFIVICHVPSNEHSFCKATNIHCFHAMSCKILRQTVKSFCYGECICKFSRCLTWVDISCLGPLKRTVSWCLWSGWAKKNADLISLNSWICNTTTNDPFFILVWTAVRHTHTCLVAINVNDIKQFVALIKIVYFERDKRSGGSVKKQHWSGWHSLPTTININ